MFFSICHVCKRKAETFRMSFTALSTSPTTEHLWESLLNQLAAAEDKSSLDTFSLEQNGLPVSYWLSFHHRVRRQLVKELIMNKSINKTKKNVWQSESNLSNTIQSYSEIPETLLLSHGARLNKAAAASPFKCTKLHSDKLEFGHFGACCFLRCHIFFRLQRNKPRIDEFEPCV